MDESKLESLRKVFRNRIEQYFVTLGYYSRKRNFTADDLAEDLVNKVIIHIDKEGLVK